MSPSLGKHLAKRVVRVAALSAAFAALLTSPIVTAQVCPFDNGGSTLENDGLVLTRYALGLRGAPMVANTSFAAADAPTIESTIACPSCGLRVTDDKDALNNPIFTVADATIISRKIAGFSGDTLTNGIASLGSGTRNTPAAVQSFLLAGCGATGGTVTSVTAGAGLTGGTITASGTLAADTTYLQRRISTPCGAGSYVTAIAADGTPSCGTPAAGGSGTVTSVGAGYGLVANGPNVVGNAVVSNGLIELANGYILPQGCTAGQVPKSAGNGSWNCAADNTAAGAGGGTVTSITLGDGLTSNVALPFTSGGVITSSGTITLPVPYRLPQTCAIGQVPQLQFGHWACADIPAVGNAFLQGGNTFGATAILGTTDAQNLRLVSGGRDIRATIAGKQHGLRITQATGAGVTSDTAPNVINGHEANSGPAGVSAGITIAGGGAGADPDNNVATASFATISGGTANRAAAYATVSGGEFNRATADLAAIGGGLNNVSAGYSASVGGGVNNLAEGSSSAIGGGAGSTAGGNYSTVSGGYNNRTAGNYSSASGGHTSYALGNYSAVSGGEGNTASGYHSIVAGGQGNQATANWSATLGGLENVASGLYSVAAGAKAKASATGSFVWADTQPGAYFGGVNSETQTVANSFNLRASGGVNFSLGKTNPVGGSPIGLEYFTALNQDNPNERIGIASFHATRLGARSLSSATSLFANGQIQGNGGLQINGFFGSTNCFIIGGAFCLDQTGEWTSISDRGAKTAFANVDAAKVLENVLALPVQYWTYVNDQIDGRYIGPMAQDFKRLFQVGTGDKTISSTNASGVALAAIQGLNQKLNMQIKAKDQTIAKLSARLAAIEARLGLK